MAPITIGDKTLSVPYDLFVPPVASPDVPSPLILWIGGAGQNSGVTPPDTPVWNMPDVRNNLFPQDTVTPAAATFPYFVMAMQYPGTSNDAGFVRTVGRQAQYDCVRDICNRYNIDRRRIICMGYSTGSGALYQMMYKWPGTFAGFVILDGQANYITMSRPNSLVMPTVMPDQATSDAEFARVVGGTPIWHNFAANPADTFGGVLYAANEPTHIFNAFTARGHTVVDHTTTSVNPSGVISSSAKKAIVRYSSYIHAQLTQSVYRLTNVDMWAWIAARRLGE